MNLEQSNRTASAERLESLQLIMTSAHSAAERW
jgi:hypothetical protein